MGSKLGRAKLNELIKTYVDVEETLVRIKNLYEKNVSAHRIGKINVQKLIRQLSSSKKRLERKIGNTILLEKHHLKRRLKQVASNLSSRIN